MNAIVPQGIDFPRLRRRIDELAQIGADRSGGVSRKAFSVEYAAALQSLRTWMADAGMSTRVDAVGNLIGRMGPVGSPAVISGSHVDSVPQGGPLDGAYGVLAAIECAHVLGERKHELAKAFEVVAFVDEEGAYLSLLGSRAFVGELTTREFEAASDASGDSLTDRMRAFGLRPEDALNARREASEIAAFIELHIEQGPVLEQAGCPIGLVEGIVGVLVLHFEFRGRADHAGTAPMAGRKDALRCAAEFVASAYAEIVPLLSEDDRITFSRMGAEPLATNVVPRTARVSVDLRSLKVKRLEELANHCAELARSAALRHGLEITIKRGDLDTPSLMSPSIGRLIEESCEDLDIRCLRMCSGAGHDAQVLARHTETAMIFVPSVLGASHRSDEHTHDEHLHLGAEVLLQVVQRLTMGTTVQ